MHEVAAARNKKAAGDSRLHIIKALTSFVELEVAVKNFLQSLAE